MWRKVSCGAVGEGGAFVWGFVGGFVGWERLLGELLAFSEVKGRGRERREEGRGRGREEREEGEGSLGS